MKVADQIKDKVTLQGQGHSEIIYEVIYNGYGIEVLDPASITGARTPLPNMMNVSRCDFLMG